MNAGTLITSITKIATMTTTPMTTTGATILTTESGGEGFEDGVNSISIEGSYQMYEKWVPFSPVRSLAKLKVVYRRSPGGVVGIVSPLLAFVSSSLAVSTPSKSCVTQDCCRMTLIFTVPSLGTVTPVKK